MGRDHARSNPCPASSSPKSATYSPHYPDSPWPVAGHVSTPQVTKLQIVLQGNCQGQFRLPAPRRYVMDNMFDPPTTGDPTSSRAADAPRLASAVPTLPSAPVNGGVPASSPVATSAPTSSPARVQSPLLSTQPCPAGSGQNPAPSMRLPGPAHGHAPSALTSPPRRRQLKASHRQCHPRHIPRNQGSWLPCHRSNRRR